MFARIAAYKATHACTCSHLSEIEFCKMDLLAQVAEDRLKEVHSTAYATQQRTAPFPNISHFDISEVDIIFQRPAEATHDVEPRDSQGVVGKYLTQHELQKLSVELSTDTHETVIKSGHYLPNGLTNRGVRSLTHFVEEKGDYRLDNVYALICSPTTRAFQTLKLASQSYDLVGHRHNLTGSDRSNPTIYCHPGLLEPAPMLHDLSPNVFEEEGKKIAAYLMLHGGSSRMAGQVIREEKVDIGDMVWPTALAQYASPARRLRAVTRTPDIDVIQRQARSFRRWLLGVAEDVLQEHQEQGRPGRARIVVCADGGILCFLAQYWNCAFERHDWNRTWEWTAPTKLNHLDICVYRFKFPSTTEALLEEVPHDLRYRAAFDDRYKLLETGPHLTPMRGNRSFPAAGQQQEHWIYLRHISRQLQEFAKERPEVFKMLFEWTGAWDIATRFLIARIREINQAPLLADMNGVHGSEGSANGSRLGVDSSD